MPGNSRDSRSYYHHHGSDEDNNEEGNEGRPSHDWVDTVETRFPSSAMMFYQSDAQRSDTATVCSGSVIEDIEVESVLSQEDGLALPGGGKPIAAGGLASGGADRGSGTQQSQRDGNRTHLMEFADAVANVDNHTTGSDMGPPLNRTLLLQQEYATLSTNPPSGLSPSSLLKSFGSVGRESGGIRNSSVQYSDDCESHHSKDEDGSMLIGRDDVAPPTSEALSLKNQSDAALHHHFHSTPDRAGVGVGASMSTATRTDSVKSYGSGSAADTDDCGGSLDVETHSVGTRSIHSQDDGLLSLLHQPSSATATLSEPELDSAGGVIPTTLASAAPVENGRRSPGGTIYKGRGIRRYQGRYMHLPLKRFHQNGVHLDETEDHDYERPTLAAALPNHVERFTRDDHDHGDDIHPDWNDPRRDPERDGRSRRRFDEGHRPHSTTSRSRSRSRSPPMRLESSTSERDADDADEDDRKPRARR